MHEPTNPLAVAPSRPMRRWIEKPRVAPSETLVGYVPGPVERTAATFNHSDAITILREKRDRYKQQGRPHDAATVESCIRALQRGVK